VQDSTSQDTSDLPQIHIRQHYGHIHYAQPNISDVSREKGFHKTSHIQEVGMRLRSWLRHYATSQKVPGSIPDEVTGFFN
jgi:hypothetical protein